MTVAEQPRASSQAAVVLGGLSVLYLSLALLSTAPWSQPHRSARAVVAAATGVALLLAWAYFRRRPKSQGMAIALAALPIASCLVEFGVIGDPHQTPVLLALLVATGAGIRSRAAVLVIMTTAGAAWLAVATAQGTRGGLTQGFQLALACLLGGSLHIIWRTREARLRKVASDLESSEELFRGIFHASPVGIGLKDENGKFVTANPALCRLLGREEQEILGSTSVPFTHPDDRIVDQQTRQQLEAAADGVARAEKRYLRPSGEVRWAWLTVTQVAGPAGQSWRLAHIQDVTERKAAEQELRDSESNLAAVAQVARRIRTGEDAHTGIVAAARELAEASAAVLFEFDEDKVLVVTAVAGLDLLGTRLDMTGPSINAHVARTAEPLFLADAADHPMASPTLLAASRARSLLCHPLIARGTVIGVLTVAWDRRVDGMSNRLARAVTMLADEAALALDHERLLSDLEQRATHDVLTGLPNRRAWDSSLDDMITAARMTGHSVTVALADLDHFKDYNDRNGHAAGDDLLRTFATLGSSVMRGDDLLARWGGEEFAVAFPDCDAGTAHAILTRLRAVVPAGQTCSVGVATWDGYEDGKTLLKRADAALYEAKAAGRDRIVNAVPLYRIRTAPGPRERRRPEVASFDAPEAHPS